jgi:hypothetical protein
MKKVKVSELVLLLSIPAALFVRASFSRAYRHRTVRGDLRFPDARDRTGMILCGVWIALALILLLFSRLSDGIVNQWRRERAELREARRNGSTGSR